MVTSISSCTSSDIPTEGAVYNFASQGATVKVKPQDAKMYLVGSNTNIAEQATMSVNSDLYVDKDGNVQGLVFTGSQTTISASYKPAGDISTPTISVSTTSTSVQSTVALADLSMTVTGEVLSFTFSRGSTATATVLTGATASSSKPSFTGTSTTISSSYTPAGVVN